MATWPAVCAANTEHCTRDPSSACSLLTHIPAYSLPNDGEEQTRLDMQHTLWEMVLDGALGLAPVCDKSPSYVLDIGTGTGVWANDFAERNPTSGVIGTDLR